MEQSFVQRIKLAWEWIVGVYKEPPHTPVTGFLAVARLLYWQYVLRPTRRYFMGTYHGMPFLFDTKSDGSGRCYCVPELEYGLTTILRKWLTKKSVFIDGGANVGSMTFIAAQQGARVHAFEPTPHPFHLLATNVHLNQLSDQVTATQKALSDKRGVLPFYMAPDEFSCVNSFQKNPLAPTQQRIDVEVTTLDLYCRAQKIKNIDLLKLDVEGHELPALQGAKQLLAKKKIKVIYWETSPIIKQSIRQETRKFLSTYGFNHYGYDATQQRLVPWNGHHDCISIRKDVLPQFMKMVRFSEEDANFFANKKILVTGGKGFLGSHLVKELIARGAKPENIMAPRSKEYDLRDREVCAEVVKDKDIVIHLAANVGGIGYNQENPGTLFYDNLLMGVHLMEEARKARVKKFVGIGTICAYPKYTPVPFKEEDLWNGYPEETNAPYGLAKKMMLVQAEAYRNQYNFNSIYILPVNLYGPGDNFDPSSSHVIPALIKKFVEAKRNKEKEVVVWGTGKPTREFLYVEDAARGIALATEHYDKSDPVNLGASFEISIRDLATLVGKLTGYKGKIVFDSSKPDGQPRRKLDVRRAKEEFNFESQVSFEEGLKKTISWYLAHYKQ